MGIKIKKDNTICFQTNSEIKSSLEKIAEKESQSVSSVVETIIHDHFKNEKAGEGVTHNRRRFERKKISIPAYIGDTRWQRHDFVAGTILDISFGGIKMSIPKGTRLEIQNVRDTGEFNIIFSIPTSLWPISMKINPRRVFESAEEIQLGASLIDPSFQAYSALQKCLSN